MCKNRFRTLVNIYVLMYIVSTVYSGFSVFLYLAINIQWLFKENGRKKEASCITIIPFETIYLRRQHVLGGGGVSPCADGPKVTVHKDQKSPS